jgi:hypothetical protein
VKFILKNLIKKFNRWALYAHTLRQQQLDDFHRWGVDKDAKEYSFLTVAQLSYDDLNEDLQLKMRQLSALPLNVPVPDCVSNELKLNFLNNFSIFRCLSYFGIRAQSTERNRGRNG